MPSKTLTSYIRSMNDENLNKLFEYVVAEMNRRKANERKADVGFWNSDGVYIEDIQKIDESEYFQSLNKEEKELGICTRNEKFECLLIRPDGKFRADVGCVGCEYLKQEEKQWKY